LQFFWRDIAFLLKFLGSMSACSDVGLREAHLHSSKKPDLSQLIIDVGAGDRDAFQELYVQTSPKLFAVILRIIRNASLAEDILQDVFLRIWRNSGTFSVELRNPMAWLNSIARNRTIDVLRQKKLTSLSPDPKYGDWFEKIAEPRDREADMMDIAALRHCLGEIEEPARSCVLAAYYEGYSRDELSVRFDKPVNTIKTWLHRSLVALKTCLDTTS
jgi:RNA polymerase sigma factor (sigma-70 family)